jgi:ABC-type lipoprotein release transport system permease subunit
LYGVGALDPLTVACACVLLVVTVLAACYLPARRSTRVDPAITLKVD